MKSGLMAANQSVFIYKKTVMLLILIFCVGCLGSMPVSAYLLPSFQQPIVKVPPKTYQDGQCNATEKTVVYQPTRVSQGKKAPIKLPAAWSHAKRGQQDFVNAQLCAAAFVDTYQSFDYRNLNTLQSAVFMLSSAAQKRFYEGSGKVRASQRLNSQWRGKIQLHKVVQVAQATPPTMLVSEYTGGTLYVTFDVPYQLTTHMDGKATTKNYHDIVLLKSVTPDTHLKGTGWQISDNRDSNQQDVGSGT